MFGFAPLAAAPLGAPGDAGTNYDVSVEAAAVIGLDSTVAQAAFPVAVSHSADLMDVTAPAPSTFNASLSGLLEVSGLASADAEFSCLINESAQGSEQAAVAAVFAALVAEGLEAAESVLVEPSIFNATVSETVTAQDQVLALAVFFAIISDGAVGADEMLGRLLWQLINTSQTTDWKLVKTQT